MPRHPSFKHEYWDGKLHWTPRPNTCDVYLDLAHLDWIFVAWMEQRRGIGTLLLGAVVSELRALGHSTLASTVLTGNAAPMLWHWRSGFHLPRDG